MLAEAVLSGWIVFTCMISGEVNWNPSQSTANLKASCPISFEVHGSLITLSSKRWVVEIPIPEEPGSQSFVYRWGQPEAQVGEHVVKISYGPAGGV
jgi:hypothetical protein